MLERMFKMNNKKRALIGFICFFVLTFLAIPQKAQSYEIINETGMNVSKIYVSLAGVGKWTNNLLTRDKMLPGESAFIDLPSSQECYYDVKYLSSDGKEYTLTHIRMCDNANLTFIPIKREQRPGVTD